MVRIVLDASVHEKLQALLEPAELVTAEGQVIARVFPKIDARRVEGAEPQIDEAEIDRRLANKHTARTHSTAEVLKHLENL